jgi:hypothetical protein
MGSVKQLEQILKNLDAVCSDLKGAAQPQLATQSNKVAEKLRKVVKRSKALQQLAQVVRAKQWAEAVVLMRLLKCQGGRARVVDQVLALLYEGGTTADLLSAITWVVQVHPQSSRLGRYREIFEQLKLKGFTADHQSTALLLRRRFKQLQPLEGLNAEVLAQLDTVFLTIVDQIAERVESKDYSISDKIYNEIGMSGEVVLLMNEIVAAVVAKFEPLNLDKTLLLIQFSLQSLVMVNCCTLIDTLLKSLAARDLLSSESAMQVWVHARFVKEHDPNWDKVAADVQKLLTDALETLAQFKSCYMQHYQKHVESEDEQEILQLHQQNWHLFCIVADFVTWRNRDEGSSSRVQNLRKLLPASRATSNYSVVQFILCQLIINLKHEDTFESFCFLNEIKQQMELNFNEPQKKEMEEVVGIMKSEMPTCLRLLLWPEQQIRLVNKFCDTALCIQGREVVCCNSQQDDEQLFTATVHPETTLTCFELQSGDSLDAAALDGTALNASHWKLWTAAGGHVKICTHDGKQRYFALNNKFCVFCRANRNFLLYVFN